jgi:hypothetical protein
METANNPVVTEWLSLAELRQLLVTGELRVDSPAGSLRLYVNSNDRVAARELGEGQSDNLRKLYQMTKDELELLKLAYRRDAGTQAR